MLKVDDETRQLLQRLNRKIDGYLSSWNREYLAYEGDALPGQDPGERFVECWSTTREMLQIIRSAGTLILREHQAAGVLTPLEAPLRRIADEHVRELAKADLLKQAAELVRRTGKQLSEVRLQLTAGVHFQGTLFEAEMDGIRFLLGAESWDFIEQQAESG